MSHLTYKEILADTLTAETLKRLFDVVTDNRTAALAIFYVSIHEAKNDAELEDIRKALTKGKRR